MKNRKMLLPALLSIALVFSLILPASAVAASAIVHLPDDHSIIHSTVDSPSAALAMALNTPQGQLTPQVAAGDYHAVGLKSDGTVVAVGFNQYGQCDVGGWTYITQASAGWGHTVGLKSDGTVVAVGDNWRGQCDVGGWTGIIQVSAGAFHTVGLKSDGTVVAAGIEVELAKWNLGAIEQIVGETREVNSAILSGVTITLHQDDVDIVSAVSDGDGNYALAVPELGDYVIVARKDGFRSKIRTISVIKPTTYTLNFVGDYSLIPNAPNMSYVLACINLWKFGTPPYQLNMSTVLAVINAWKFPMLQYNLTITSTIGGTVTNPGEGTFTYDEGTVVDLDAEADEGYQFVNWTGDVGTIAHVDDATTTITLNRDCTITANFMIRTVNVLIVTTSLLQKTPDFEATVNQYQSVLEATESLTASYIELDSDECLDAYGIKVNDPTDWEEIQDVLEEIIRATGASYVMILGGKAVLPRPNVDILCSGEEAITVPSDAWYIDLDGDQIVDEGLSISRLPDLSRQSSAVTVALQTAITLHNAGGFTLDTRIDFGQAPYTAPPYGACDACSLRSEFFDLMSSRDYIFFWGHGSPTTIASYSLDLMFSTTFIDSVNFEENHPVIIALNPCHAGGLYIDYPTLSYEFIKAGAAAYIANTAAQGYNAPFRDILTTGIEGGVRIGDALFQAMRESILTGTCYHKASSQQFALYGDLTLMRR